MGVELANSAVRHGAEVVLISGPSKYNCDADNVNNIAVVNTKEMNEAVQKYYPTVDVAIMSAAVSDFRLKNPLKNKIKKKSNTLSLDLEKTEDILALMGAQKKDQFLIGFALETDNEIENAIKKLRSKNLDLIVLNSLNDKGAGFGGSTNKITIIDKDLNQKKFSLKSKAEVADDIINELIKKSSE